MLSNEQDKEKISEDASWAELLELMTSPDPQIRDGWALEQLAEGILSGRWKSEHPLILANTLNHFDYSEIQARTFAPLILCWLLQTGARDEEIFERCSRWYLEENDTRGYDAQLGWLHAIAHGADCLGYCGQYKIATGEQILSVFAKRILKDCEVWTHQEEARIVLAIIRTLYYQPETKLSSFFQPLTDALYIWEEKKKEENSPGGRAAWLTNLQMTLNTFYLCANERIRLDDKEKTLPRAEEIKENLMSLNRRTLEWLLK
ncbi:DUF2785 domain-containing protein [Actinomycetaceae bacterium TAE3-ERU4]|nr:DUF2785 domain-containing protein [Actinomycetaceae bacterium TAE3-ERU4]